MLINLSNHPYSKWNPFQKKSAEERFGKVMDILFPQINSDAPLEEVKKLVFEKIDECVRYESKGDGIAIHIMGESTFTYQFVKEMEKRGILCVSSTTERKVKDNPDGTKMSEFKFTQFRPYF